MENQAATSWIDAKVQAYDVAEKAVRVGHIDRDEWLGLPEMVVDETRKALEAEDWALEDTGGNLELARWEVVDVMDGDGAVLCRYASDKEAFLAARFYAEDDVCVEVWRVTPTGRGDRQVF